MKKIFSILMVAFSMMLSTYAQEKKDATYIDESERVVEIRGSSWVLDYTSMGWSVGTYSDAPNERYNYLILYNYGSPCLQVQPGSKLILKVNGQPMVLTTEQGTHYDGSTVFVERLYNSTYGMLNYFASTVYYEVTQEQADAINKYGITKYRYQVDGTVFERDNMNSEKIAKKMNKSYDRVVDKLARINKKVEDLSDF